MKDTKWLDEIRTSIKCRHCDAIDFIELDDNAKAQILQKIQEAIGEDTTDDNLLPELRGTLSGNAFKLSRNSLRKEIKQRLGLL